MTAPARQIAIIGAGPSGCYLADALGRKFPDAAIDIFDRLPTPFGLVRGGVAPDHQGTKNISRQFERTLGKDSVRFFGHVEIGRDLSVPELQECYDLIAVATGALEDRRLGIPGEDLDGVYGSGAFVSWYNGIPDGHALAPRLDARSVAIVGNGNVALDIARLLAKTPAELASSDLCRHAREAFAAMPLTDIWLLGRRGPAEASFTTAELAEFGELARVRPRVDASQLPASLPDGMPDEQRKVAEKNLAVLKDYAERTDGGQPIRLHFAFFSAPVALHGDGAVAEIEVERTELRDGKLVMSGERQRIPAQLVIGAIGYRSRPLPGLPFDAVRGVVANDSGRVAAGIYTAGWCKRGPQGVVPANRADALAVAELIAADAAGSVPAGKPGRARVAELLATRQVQVVDFAGWQRINAAETAAGTADGRPREKLTRIAELLAAAG